MTGTSAPTPDRPAWVPYLVAASLSLLGGVLMAIQPRINATLADRISSGVVAALLSFSVGLLAVCLIALGRPTTRRGFSLVRGGGVPWWCYLSGLGGASAVTAGAIVVPIIGVSLFTVALYTGQLAAGLFVDRWGLGPRGRQPITLPRLLGAMLALVAVAISQVDNGIKDFSIGIVLAVVAAGVAVALQTAMNGRLGQAAKDPMTATFINFLGGTVALAIVVAIAYALGRGMTGQWPSEPWLYLGGFLGVTFIAITVVTVRLLGVLVVTLVALAGQLLGAVVIDAIVLGGLGLPVIVGAMLIFVAVGLSSIPRVGRVSRLWQG